jgi:hypothetical protein
MKRTGKIAVCPSTSLRYAQDERFSYPFVLSVTHRVKSKHERRSPGTFHLGNLYNPALEDDPELDYDDAAEVRLLLERVVNDEG